MSKTKSSDNQHYELLYIISNKFSEDEVVTIKEKIINLIKEQGGNITLQEDWGKKRLAYGIAGFQYGYYQLVEFDLESVKQPIIDRGLRLSPEIIRFLTIKKRLRSEAEIAKDKKIQEKIAKRAANEQAQQDDTKAKAASKAKQEKAEEPKVDLKDLDQKLDDILDSSDLL